MLALVFKDTIDARIGGSFKPTYLELNQMHLKDWTHEHGCMANQLSGSDIWNTEKWVDHVRPSI